MERLVWEVLMMVEDEVECMLKDNFEGWECVVGRMAAVRGYGMELDRAADVVVGGGDVVDNLGFEAMTCLNK
jgi:hypothetical protein